MTWYRLIRSPVPEWFLRDSMAIWPFVLDASGSIPADTLRHEVQHLRQQLVTALLAAAVIIALPVSLWWLLLIHPLPYGLAYIVVGLVKGYRRSWFERDADRKR